MSQAIIQSPARNLEKSKRYYEKLGFITSQYEERHFALSQNLVIELNTLAYKRPGITLHFKSETIITDNAILGKKYSKKGDSLLIKSPSGCNVYIEPIEDGPKLKQIDTPSLLGNYMGMSLETNTIQDSIKFWQQLEFKITSGSSESGWILLTNKSGFSISLMNMNSCPHLFINPSLTYFNGEKNEAIIQEIRNQKIPIFEEITHFNKENKVDNIIIQDPGGLGYFIFND